jgi:PLP dependent protein
MSARENYNRIIESVRHTALAAGRDPSHIKIISVSKTFPAADVQTAINDGITLFGENKVQEAKSKIPGLTGNFTFHLIGHLQSNKAKEAVKLFDVIHSIDKLSTASEVSKEALKIEKIQKILVQVNTSGEDTKSGCEPAQAPDLCRSIRELPNVALIGLMTIGPLSGDTDSVRKSFKMLKTLRDTISGELNMNLPELSMGMSSDFLTAVEEGATMLRIGSALFGNRDYTV